VNLTVFRLNSIQREEILIIFSRSDTVQKHKVRNYNDIFILWCVYVFNFIKSPFTSLQQVFLSFYFIIFVHQLNNFLYFFVIIDLLWVWNYVMETGGMTVWIFLYVPFIAKLLAFAEIIMMEFSSFCFQRMTDVTTWLQNLSNQRLHNYRSLNLWTKNFMACFQGPIKRWYQNEVWPDPFVPHVLFGIQTLFFSLFCNWAVDVRMVKSDSVTEWVHEGKLVKTFVVMFRTRSFKGLVGMVKCCLSMPDKMDLGVVGNHSDKGIIMKKTK